MNRLAVIGHPVAHSLSPAMHSAAFAALGIDDEWSYEAIDLDREGFEAGIAELRERGFAGVNVTIPHKEAALKLADRPSSAAVGIGAANTLSFDSIGIRADNTDASGLIAALPEGFDLAGARVLVLGAGGSARASAWALAGAGAEVFLANRTAAKAAQVAAELGVGTFEDVSDDGMLPLEGFALLVNATSIGLAKGDADPSEPAADLKALRIGADQLVDPLVVVDLVYGSQPTGLTAISSRGGATIVNGLEILVRQGAESFRIWTGREPPIEIMRSAVRNQQR
jgi:shikimate dehydrogenase